MLRYSGFTADSLISGIAEVAAQQAQAALRFERTRGRAHDVVVGALRDAGRVVERAIGQARFVAIGAHAAGHDGGDVVVHQPGIEQFAEHELDAAGGGEAVHVGVAVRIDARQQRHGLRDRVDVVPAQRDAGRARDRDPVDACGWWSRRSPSARRWR